VSASGEELLAGVDVERAPPRLSLRSAPSQTTDHAWRRSGRHDSHLCEELDIGIGDGLSRSTVTK
jgi:hypothetical protein